MVRIMVGTLVSVAFGNFSPEDITSMLESKSRTKAGMTAPPDGLYLNKVIYKYNPNTASKEEIGKGVLKSPTGVCVDVDGNIYVADEENKKVFIFDKTFNLVKEIGRPTEPLFGNDSQYTPTKVAVDRVGNMYITSTGNANGVIQINKDGSFVGYFGRNTKRWRWNKPSCYKRRKSAYGKCFLSRRNLCCAPSGIQGQREHCVSSQPCGCYGKNRK
jgi:hypothetical protein